MHKNFSEIKNALAHSQIEWRYEIAFSRARGKAWRAPGNRVCCRERHAGESGTDQLYYVYVHKYDSDKAWKVLRKLIG